MTKNIKENIIVTIMAFVTVIFIYIAIFYVCDLLDQWIME